MTKEKNSELDKSKSSKTLREYSTNKSNPFLANLLVPSRNKSVMVGNDSGKIIVDRETKTQEQTLYMTTKKQVDDEHFIKVYLSSLQAIFNLSKQALKVFSYLASLPDFNDDQIVFILDDCKAFTKFNSHRPIYAGIVELIEAEIIARGPAYNLYFINPSVFFKGDRLVLMTEYRKVKTKVIPENQLDLFEREGKKSKNPAGKDENQ